jgi:hypothetical protein
MCTPYTSPKTAEYCTVFGEGFDPAPQERISGATIITPSNDWQGLTSGLYGSLILKVDHSSEQALLTLSAISIQFESSEIALLDRSPGAQLEDWRKSYSRCPYMIAVKIACS